MEIFGLSLIAIALIWSRKPPTFKIHYQNTNTLPTYEPLTEEELQEIEEKVNKDPTVSFAEALSNAMTALGGDDE